jgi:hypothetical protein
MESLDRPPALLRSEFLFSSGLARLPLGGWSWLANANFRMKFAVKDPVLWIKGDRTKGGRYGHFGDYVLVVPRF